MGGGGGDEVEGMTGREEVEKNMLQNNQVREGDLAGLLSPNVRHPLSRSYLLLDTAAAAAASANDLLIFTLKTFSPLLEATELPHFHRCLCAHSAASWTSPEVKFIRETVPLSQKLGWSTFLRKHSRRLNAGAPWHLRA